MTTQSLFEEYRAEMEDFLNGFEVDASSPTRRSGRGRSEARLETLTGEHGTYSIEYDASLWEAEPEVTGDEDFFFSHCDGEAYGMIVAERAPMSRKYLRGFVIENVEAVASECSIVEERMLTHGGVEILCLTMSAMVDGIPLIYYGYYYTGEVGTIQVVTFTTPNAFEDYRSDMEDFLNGLTVLED